MRKKEFSPPENRWKARCSKWRITGRSRPPGRDFLARVAPRVAIISSEGGADERGGLPNPETLEVLQNAGARIFRTDTDGATTVEWKEGSLVVRTYRGTETVVMTGEGKPMVPH